MIDVCVVIYLDDILIYSIDLDHHVLLSMSKKCFSTSVASPWPV